MLQLPPKDMQLVSRFTGHDSNAGPELCKQKGVYLLHQVRYVHIYSEFGDRVPGVPREGPELRDSP